MRKTIIVLAAVALVMSAGLGLSYAQNTAAPAYAQGGWHSPWQGAGNGDGYVRPARGGWYCPWGGGGYRQGPAPARGYGWMGNGGCMGYGYGGYGMRYRGWGPGMRYGQGYSSAPQNNQNR